MAWGSCCFFAFRSECSSRSWNRRASATPARRERGRGVRRYRGDARAEVQNLLRTAKAHRVARLILRALDMDYFSDSPSCTGTRPSFRKLIIVSHKRPAVYRATSQEKSLLLAVVAALMVPTMRAKVLQVVDLVTSSYIVYVLAPR